MFVDLEMMELFDELESVIKNASSIPFSQKSGIDKEEVLRIISEIKAIIPEEVKQADWINKERHKLINDAKQEASKLVEQANKEAENIKAEYNKIIEDVKKNSESMIEEYVESSNPVALAEKKADEIIKRAESFANEIKLGSIDYAENVLTTVEYNLKDILQEVIRDKAELNPSK